MCSINNILKKSRNHIKNLKRFQQVYVVLGNESCDLDSAISSLVYSVLLCHKHQQDTSIVFPVLNIPRIQLPVKTELNYFLKKNDVDIDSVICKDEIDLVHLHKEGLLRLTLVDHHALEGELKELQDSVVTVIDHRPQDPAWLWNKLKADFTLQQVGSCCTLVADKLISQAPQLVTPTIALLLLGVIVIDTNIFLPSAGLATELDKNIADKLESMCDKPIDRNRLFTKIQAAKRDISSLTTAQLLIKDFKVADGIPIAGLPIKIQTFLDRKDAVNAIEEFCKQYETNLCVLYGMEATSNSITRDLAVYTSSKTEAAQKLVQALIKSKDPDFKLRPIPCKLKGVSLFEQTNVSATRKQILPIVKKVGETLKK